MQLPVFAIAFFFSLLFLAGMVFVFLVWPIFLLIHSSKRFPAVGKKAGWIFAMLMIWPFANYLYGVFYLEKVWHKFLNWVGILVLAGLTIFVLQNFDALLSEAKALKTNLEAVLEPHKTLS